MSRSSLLAAASGCVFLCVHAPVAAQASLPAVAVTGLRESQPLDRVIGDVVVLDGARLRDSGADSLEDALRRVGGLQLSRNGGPGQSAGLLLRGNSAANTVVLVDGVRVGSATLGQVDLSAFSLEAIERVEILRGPGSSLYGADAVGGVVRIVTRTGRGEPVVDARASVGQLRSLEAGAGVRGSTGAFDYAVSGQRERSDGVSAVAPTDSFGRYNPDRDGFSRSGLQLRAGVTPAQGHRIGIALQRQRLDSAFDSAEFLPPTFAADPAFDFRSRLDTSIAAADWRGELAPTWSMSLQASEQRDELESGAATISRYDTRRRQLTWQNALQLGGGQQVVAALERLAESIDSTAYAAPERTTNSAVVAWSGSFGAHRFQVDGRHDDNSVSGAVNTGKLGWAWDPAPGWTLRASGGTAFRAPSFNDLYFPGFGVASLRPERSGSVEVGVSWRDGSSSASVTVYEQRVRDLIGYEPDATLCPADPSYAFGCARNIDRARLRGATLGGEHRAGPWSLNAAIDFLDATNRATGQRLARRAAHQESLGVTWSDGPWTAGGTLLGVGARPEGGVTLPAYQRLDLHALWRVAPTWRLEARLLNALDKDYAPARDYQTPGRQAFIGVRYDSGRF